MNIAIIGSGTVGKALAGSCIRGGHTVTIGSTSAAKAQEAATATGARAAASAGEAVKAAELVILAVPAAAVDQVVTGLGNAVDGKILVDVTNRVNPTNPGQVLDGTSMAERIQSRAPSAYVVKAFNTAFASRQADPTVDGMQVDGYVAGDDEKAKAAVLQLVGSIGFRPIDAGPLVMARALEAMALVIITLQMKHGWPWQSAWKLVGPTPT